MLQIPAVIDGSPYTSLERQVIRSLSGEHLAELTLTPLVKAYEALDRSYDRLASFQRVPLTQLCRAFSGAAALLRSEHWGFSSLSRDEYCAYVSESTGYPLPSMNEEIEEIADLMAHMEEIVRVQLPGEESCLDAHEYHRVGHPVGYYPSGRTLLIRIPGNIAGICSYWLIPLGLKRPLVLVPPPEDPFTHKVVLDALRAAAPWLASYVSFLPCAEPVFTRLLHDVDQIMLPQSLEALVSRSPKLAGRTRLIHFGRSKLLVRGAWNESTVEVAMRRMHWRHGRTCTGLTSVIIESGGRQFCRGLAERIGAQRRDDFGGNLPRTPVFARERALQLDALIESYVRKGLAEDITQAVNGGKPRILIDGERAMLMPTVLWLRNAHCEAFGLELPFPFVTVAECTPGDDWQQLAANTLILSVIGADDRLLEQLAYDTTIHKIFTGTHVERGYHWLDPHEGYLADFLYQKKAVLPAWGAPQSMPQ